MESLKKMWKLQKDFNKKVLEKKGAVNQQELTKEYILHLLSECDEILREINWKLHKKHNKVIDKNKLTEELIDAFKYWLSITILWDVSPEEFVKEFERKSQVVEQKFKQEMQLDLINDNKVIGIDIDGVLAKYPESFIKFIEDQEQINLNFFKFKRYDIYGQLSKFIDGGEKRMKELKHLYRLTGQKRFIEVVEGSVEGLKQLKMMGYSIVLLTARPYKQYRRIFSDTLEWLKENKFEFDAIVWDEEKEERIIKEFPKMKVMVEDVASNANKIARKGYKVFLLDKLYNQLPIHENVIRVKNWEEILKHEQIKKKKDSV